MYIKIIESGKYNVSLDGVLEEANRIRLEALCYKVTTGNQHNEPYFTISW
jgi:hypothetical protein